MLKKLTLAALACLLLVPSDVSAKKCKQYCSLLTQILRVCGNAQINGNLTVDGTINNETLNNILINLGTPQTDFIFAYSDEIQLYDETGDFLPITFNVNGPLDGWAHTAGSENFTIPATGLYLVSYSANIGFPGLDDTVAAGIAAFAGTLGSETQIAGSDSSVQFLTPDTGTQIFTASSSFLFNGVAGQNLYLALISEEGSTISLTRPDVLSADIPTTIALSITRIR